MTLTRLAGIMQARGVRGVLVCPMPAAHTNLDFPWTNFSAVSLGHTLDRPALNLVAANHYQSLRLIFRHLTEIGCQRIGPVLPGDLNARVGDQLPRGLPGRPANGAGGAAFVAVSRDAAELARWTCWCR